MKKIIFAIIVSLFFFSCKNFMQQDITYPKLPDGVYDIETAYLWVSSNIDFYTSEELHDDPGYFQGPKETMKLRKGNCVASAILLSTFTDILGYDSRIAIGNGHCVSIIDGIQYSPGKVLSDEGYVPDKFEIDTSIYDFTYNVDIWNALERAYYRYDSE